MLCYRDMTFCSQKCGNTKCRRNFTDEVSMAADLWWGDEADGGPPIAMADFKSDSCGYVPPEEMICHLRTHGQGTPLLSLSSRELLNITPAIKKATSFELKLKN